MNAMTLNMTAATASIGDNSAARLDDTLAKMAALGRAEANGLGSRRDAGIFLTAEAFSCLLYTSPSPRDRTRSRMPSSA